MTSRTALLAVCLLLFQSHWVDDALSGGPDMAGGIVSAIGTVPLLAGLVWNPRRGISRLVVAAGLGFVAFISVADLAGLQPDGSLVPDVGLHWRDTLGWPVTVVVALTLAAALASLVALRTDRPPA